MGLLQRVADSWGQAVGTYQKARQEALRGRRPAFFSSWAQQGKWQGGWQWGASDLERQKRAIQNSWIYVAISMVAREASAARLQIVEHHGPDEEPTQVHNHPLEKLLRRPNPYMGRAFLWQYSYWWLKLDGNFYWYVLVGDDGCPRELWPLPSFAIRCWPGDGDRLIDYYEYSIGGHVYRIPAEYVVHVKQPNPFSIFSGLSELIAAMLPADSDLAMSRWNGAFFGKQNTMPSAIINLSSGDPNLPINPADRDRLQADLEEDYAAFQRKTLVTSANSVSATLLGWNAKDMDFSGGRQFSKEEILAIYGVPAGVVDPSATEANALAAKGTLKENTIWPFLVLVAEQLTAELVVPFYSGGYRVSPLDRILATLSTAMTGISVYPPSRPVELEAQFEDIRPVNREMELRERESARGVMTIDEIRERYFQLTPLPDERGEVLEGEFATMEETPLFPLEPMVGGLTDTAQGDLRKWKAKSLKALKRGDSADVIFESAAIPDQVAGHLHLRLQEATLAEDVIAVFEEVAAVSPFSGKVRRPFRPWSQFENRLQALVEQVLEREGQRIIGRIEQDGPEVLSEGTLWTEHETNLYNAIHPIIERLALFGVQKVREQLGDAGVNINWNLANDRATEWARQHAGERSRTLTETTRKQVQATLAEWTQAAEGLPELIARIGEIVPNPVRAEMIAVTEATNVYAEANSAAWTQAGYAQAVYKPPAHVRCRCWPQPYKLPDGSKVLVWYTARDELVCKQPLTVPWQAEPVKGCRALHTVVVSEGPYLGLRLSQAIQLARQRG